MPKICFDPARSTRTCSGSRVFLWGARAASLRVSAASRNGLSTSACSGRIHNASPARTFFASRQNGLSRIGEHTRLACWSRRPRRTHFVQSNADFARAAQANFSSSIPSRLRYRVSRLYRASSHQMSITRTSARNPGARLIVTSSPADSKLDR
jgi:hypothetical protein